MHEESPGLSGGPHFSLGGLRAEAIAVVKELCPSPGSPILTVGTGSYMFPPARFPLMTKTFTSVQYSTSWNLKVRPGAEKQD